MTVTRRIVLRFPKRLVERPIVYRLVKDYDLEFNILKASITPEEEGLLVLELKGSKDEYERGIDFLDKAGVKMQPLSQDITRNDARCTSCGACITVCPTGALYVDRKTGEVVFDSQKCIACALCIPACPPRAMEVHF